MRARLESAQGRGVAAGSKCEALAQKLAGSRSRRFCFFSVWGVCHACARRVGVQAPEGWGASQERTGGSVTVVHCCAVTALAITAHNVTVARAAR